MAEVDATARQWGDSIAIIIPREVVVQENIKPKDRVHIVLQKEYDFRDIFGTFKIKKTPQQLKDASRTGWE